MSGMQPSILAAFAKVAGSPESKSVTRVVRLRRQGGRVVQDCDVYIGRAWTRGGWQLAESKWHNPHRAADCGGSVTAAIERFRAYVLARPELVAALPELRGKTLGCWCKPGPCHGDVLAALADSPPVPTSLSSPSSSAPSSAAILLSQDRDPDGDPDPGSTAAFPSSAS